VTTKEEKDHVLIYIRLKEKGGGYVINRRKGGERFNSFLYHASSVGKKLWKATSLLFLFRRVEGKGGRSICYIIYTEEKNIRKLIPGGVVGLTEKYAPRGGFSGFSRGGRGRRF